MVAVSNIQKSSGEVRGTVTAGRRQHVIRFASADLDLWPAPEAFLLLALPAAMRRGEPLRLEQPVSRRLLGSLPAIQSVLARWQPGMREIAVHASGCADETSPATGQCLFFTGGVDSFHSALRMPAADLVFVHGLDIGLEDRALRGLVAERLRWSAAQLGRTLIEIETNLRQFMNRYLPWYLAFGAALAACGYLMSRRFGRVGISTTYGGADQELAGRALADGGHPSLVRHFSSGAVAFSGVGAESSRVDKLAELADSPTVQTALRVCWENPRGAYNCGNCEKCLRTMAALAALGKLESFTCFEQPLDYRRLRRAVPVHPSAEVFVRENLETARENQADPALIATLEAMLSPRATWHWRLYGKYVPRRVRVLLHRLGTPRAAARGSGS